MWILNETNYNLNTLLFLDNDYLHSGDYRLDVECYHGPTMSPTINSGCIIYIIYDIYCW